MQMCDEVMIPNEWRVAKVLMLSQKMIQPVSYTHLSYSLPVVLGSTSVQCCPNYCSYAPDSILVGPVLGLSLIHIYHSEHPK